MNAPPLFNVEPIGYAAGLPELRSVREKVFVHEQNVPIELELDELDPLCHHVIARDADGRAIGTGRLTPKRSIGRMAVLAEWRGRGVGDALLRALVVQARALGWRELSLHAQVTAFGFYARHGFLPVGERFVEAGIDHQTMHITLDAANPVETRDAALAAMLGVIGSARRELLVYSRELDPGLLDSPEIMAALRRFAVAGGETRIALQEPALAGQAQAPLLGLAQRLPSSFAFRAIEEPGDRAYPSAYAAGDTGGWYFRTLGHRFDGETRLEDRVRARQLRASFDPVWERARPCTEFRVLGI